MRRSRSEGFLLPGRNSNPSPTKWRVHHLFLLAVAALYLLHVISRYASFGVAGGNSVEGGPLSSSSHQSHSDPKPDKDPYGRSSAEALLRQRSREQSRRGWTGNLTELERMAADARSLGLKAWEEVKNYEKNSKTDYLAKKTPQSCPSQVYLTEKVTGPESQSVVALPCGMELGSAVTVIGVPEEGMERIGGEIKIVSNFMVELQGLNAVEGEDPPRILHLNPRIKGDWSGMPVIEHNTCYRMHWGKAMRCDGLPSENEDTVDGFSKCEKWKQSVELKGSKTTSWLNRFIGRAKKPEITWPFPFVEGKLFVLTIRAGMEGYHTHVGGRHVTSFPYQLGFSLEDATGLAIKGNVDIHSVYATSLPKSHPSSSFEQVLEMSEKWKSLPLPRGPINLFVGILSATNHFAERMAVRKSWMRYPSIKSSQVVARFFVALGPRKEVNAMLKKEADYFGDVVILPFIDHYELVVLKTIAICEYGVHNTAAAYIMKCDDDTFVRVDVVLNQIDEMSSDDKSLYMGNLNRFHRPLRSGKWAVTYEEWPEDIYPPYANGPGYVISNDIARYIVSKHANENLRLFKMEDVSMGMWVEDFNASTAVQYTHNWKFCQYGCLKNYFTAHYQSPKQMICLWDKLEKGHAECCNYR